VCAYFRLVRPDYMDRWIRAPLRGTTITQALCSLIRLRIQYHPVGVATILLDFLQKAFEYESDSTRYNITVGELVGIEKDRISTDPQRK
jgi:hypothetical protein